MSDPVFWLGLSVGLVALSLVMVLAALIPAVRELRRAARSVEKLADTLSRELPPTLEAIRLTGLEMTELTEEAIDGVKSASEVVQQVNQGVTRVKKQTQTVRTNTRSVFAGVRAAWRTWNRQPTRDRRRAPEPLPNSRADAVEFGQPYVSSSDESDEP
ncbi:MAG: DUF948 domain-containing protein [Geitlerinemataceae cyanobacterium]